MTDKPSSPKVHPAEFDELNRRFYSRPGPNEYFDNRFTALVRHLGRELPTEKTEYKYGELSVIVGPGDSSSDDGPDTEERDRFAALDATVLLHHASESLARLYLAHADRNPCPWVALAEMKQPRVFPAKLRSLRDRLQDGDAELLDDLMEVFTYSKTYKAWGDTATPESWAQHREAIAVLMEFAVTRLLDDSNLYNSAKHGFGVSAGEAGLAFGDLIKHDGPAISFLDYSPRADTPWSLSTTWVDPERYLASVFLISQQLANLWNCARAHYRHEKRGPFGIANLDPESVRKAIRDAAPGFHVSTMAMSLYVETTTD
ncbi:hypothetical protein [Cryobacterium tagatosivorans]|uniref:Uncharacterized protein n=1 Tax=Cryobacterium tagatosivorans TaxID=1259199 RepID=A0A4R8UDA0_9MICO|nr:hypothetical protein [Cryobacterium tagatosivorans]TFB50260.1 hypothetical protein E3O23_10240 [Cryobacterium tagatosivorans]